MQRTFLIGFVFLSSSLAQMHNNVAPVGSVGRAPIVAPFGRSLTPTTGGPIYNRYRRRGGYGSGIAYYPVYIGGYAGNFYSGLDEQPQTAPPAPAAPVIINQYFGMPASEGTSQDDRNVRIYSQPNDQVPAAQATSEPAAYLIAYKDHSVYSALAYWVEDHTLHYVTSQNTHNQADLNLIDLDFTKKLNQDRTVPFSLNPIAR